MKKVHGIELSLNKLEQGLWYDSDKKIYDPKGWGITLQLSAGPMTRPIPKVWKYPPFRWKTWDDPWFVIRSPFVLGVFISVAIGKYGFYLGFKNHGDKELVPSATIRSTRWK